MATSKQNTVCYLGTEGRRKLLLMANEEQHSMSWFMAQLIEQEWKRRETANREQNPEKGAVNES